MTDLYLKPCPFCGGEAVRLSIDYDEFGNCGGDVIQCGTCLASSHVEFGFKENLVVAWNTRATPTLSDALALPEIAALVEAAQHYLAQIDASNPTVTSCYMALCDLRAALSAMKGGE